MRQLQLFTTTELAAMRDRTASRSYSPAAEEFRREHERHRAWGLTRRHAERLRRLHGSDCEPHTPTAEGMHPERRALAPPSPAGSPRTTPPDRVMRPTASPKSPASQNPGVEYAADRPGRQRNGSTERAAIASSRPAGDAPRRAEKAPSRPARGLPWRSVGDAPDAPIGTGANPPSGKRAAATRGKCTSSTTEMHRGAQREAGPASNRNTPLPPGAPPIATQRGLHLRDPGGSASSRPGGDCTFAAPGEVLRRGLAGTAPSRPRGKCFVAAWRGLHLRDPAGSASLRPSGTAPSRPSGKCTVSARRRVHLRGPPENDERDRPGSDRPCSSARADLSGDGPALIHGQARQTQTWARGQSSVSGRPTPRPPGCRSCSQTAPPHNRRPLPATPQRAGRGP
jgi:hypothetical protein